VAKIDIEGAEDRVLRGMAKVFPTYIIIETHSKDKKILNPIFNQLTERGYEYTTIRQFIYAKRK
jgi:hypothetical protein